MATGVRWVDFPGGAVVKGPPAGAGDTGWTLGREDPLERKC